MKYFLLFSIISTSVFAMDFHKVTGSFDVSAEKTFVEEADSTIAVGTFGDSVQPRTPASEEKMIETTHVTEITGTFK